MTTHYTSGATGLPPHPLLAPPSPAAQTITPPPPAHVEGPPPAVVSGTGALGVWALEPAAMELVARVLSGEIVASSAIQHAAWASGITDPPAHRDEIAVISLQGMITPRGGWWEELFGVGGGGLLGFQRRLAEAVADPAVTTIVIDIDSPGGRVDLVSETAEAVRRARQSKPVIAVADTLAASAAYWIGAQADELIVTPSGMVGSIGVYTAHTDWSEALDRSGITITLVSAGRYKTEGHPYAPLAKAAREHLQSRVDAIYDQFVADVAAGRDTTEAAVRRGYGEGRVLTASAALDTGLVDRVESLTDLLTRLGADPTPEPDEPASPDDEDDDEDGDEAAAAAAPVDAAATARRAISELLLS